MDNFTSSKIFKNEDKTLDGAKFILLLNFPKKTFLYQMIGKGLSNIIIGENQTFNICLKGSFIFDNNHIYFSINQKRDLFYSKKFKKYEMEFTSGYKLIINNEKLILKLDNELPELQWGNKPEYKGFKNNVYQTYYSKV